MHFSQSGGLYTRPDGLDLREVRSYESDREHSAEQLPLTLRRYLASGVTALVDVGGPASNFSIRETSHDVSPHIALAGPLLATLTPAFEARVDRLDLGNDPTILSVENPKMGRDLVRQQFELKPDLIKVGILPPRNAQPSKAMTPLRQLLMKLIRAVCVSLYTRRNWKRRALP